jgi:nucleolar protein 56
MAQYCFVVLTELGLAIFDNNNNLIDSIKFSNPVDSFRLAKSGSKIPELVHLIDILKSYDDILVNEPSLAFHFRQAGLNSHIMSQEKQDEIQNTKPLIIVSSKFADSETQAMQLLRNFAIELSSSKVKETSERLDLHIIQCINALDELDKIINTIGARMREWYGLHFPELDNLIQSLTTYAEIISMCGIRTNITQEALENLGIQNKKSEIIMDAAKRSRGGDITPENLAIVKKLADEVISQSELRRILSDHIEISMDNVAPNVKELLTATVGARIIAKAGSLSKLAVLPSSTIQVLGAEKALFRSLKTGARPPKHGILFQHPVIHSSPRWQRGKIARAVASKVAIAARIDVYRHGGKDSSVSDRLKMRIEEIQEKYKQPVPEHERDRQYREHEGRQHQFPFAKKSSRNKNKSKNKNKDRRRFAKRRY